MTGESIMLSNHVKAWYGTIGHVLNAGTLLVTGVLVARAAGVDRLQIVHVDIGLEHTWLAFTALTVGHVFSAIFAVMYSYRLFASSAGDSELLSTYREISAHKSLYIRGVTGRDRHAHDSFIYSMRLSDPSTWVSHAGGIAFLLAMLPWTYDKGLSTHHALQPWIDILIAIVLVIVNWLAGSVWSVALWELGKPRTESTYLRGIAERRGAVR